VLVGGEAMGGGKEDGDGGGARGSAGGDDDAEVMVHDLGGDLSPTIVEEVRGVRWISGGLVVRRSSEAVVDRRWVDGKVGWHGADASTAGSGRGWRGWSRPVQIR
jgi:hypothetical protein